MKPIKFTGRRSRHMTLEEIRAYIHACCVVMEFHNRRLATKPTHLRVCFTTMKKLGSNDITGGGNAGRAHYGQCKMWIATDSIHNPRQLRTVLLHEILHLFCRWEGGQEWVTSTLTARLKRDVYRIYVTLKSNVYRRAAWIAHGQLSYKRTEEGDSYNEEQWKSESLQA